MKVVIVGAGPAGLTAAETIRQNDARAEITLLSAEPCAPYSPPALIEFFRTGDDTALFWKGRDVCERLRIDFRTEAAAQCVRPQGHCLVLRNGARLSYDRLIVATGSHLHAPVEGGDRPGVYDFKSLTAAAALIRRVREGHARRVLIVGAGFIGVELAILLAELGVTVTMVEMSERVMPRMLDDETSALVADALRARGLDLRLGVRASRFVGDRLVEGVELASGEVAAADVYVAATGVRPNVALFVSSGIPTGWGVPVDERMRTSVPDVWAAGDVAETADRLTGERYVHAIFPNAVAQARVAALDSLGIEARYEGAENLNSLNHVGIPLLAAGSMDGEVLRWRDGGCLRKLYVRDGRLVGFRLTGDVGGAGVYRSLMLRGDDVAGWGSRLAEPGFGAGRLVGAALPA